MILLKSSENTAWPWSEADEGGEEFFAHTYPAIYRHFKPHEEALRKRQDHGRDWWELRACTYYGLFEQRLAATDRLVDRVVYRLYGLSEEEIAVVKGNVGSHP